MTKKGAAPMLCGGLALLAAFLLPPFLANRSDAALLGQIETASAEQAAVPLTQACTAEERRELFIRWFAGDTTLLSSVTTKEIPPADVQSVLGSLRRLQAAGAFPAAAALESLEPYSLLYGTIVDSTDTRMVVQIWDGAFLLDGQYEIYLAADAETGEVYQFSLYGQPGQAPDEAGRAVFDVDLVSMLTNFLDYYDMPREGWWQVAAGEYYVELGDGLFYMASDGERIGEENCLSLQPASETSLSQQLAG